MFDLVRVAQCTSFQRHPLENVHLSSVVLTRAPADDCLTLKQRSGGAQKSAQIMNVLTLKLCFENNAVVFTLKSSKNILILRVDHENLCNSIMVEVVLY